MRPSPKRLLHFPTLRLFLPMKNFLLLALVALFVGSVAPANGQESTDKDIVDIAVEAGTFQTLVAAVTAADLVSGSEERGSIHRFLPQQTKRLLPSQKERLPTYSNQRTRIS